MGKVMGSLRPNSTAGERRVYQFLEETFEEDNATWCYYEPLLGDAPRYTTKAEAEAAGDRTAIEQ